MNRINSYICKNASRFIMSKDKKYLDDMVQKIDFEKAERERKYKSLEHDDDHKIVI